MPLLATYEQGTNPVARHGTVLAPPSAIGKPFTVQVPDFDASGAHVFEVIHWSARGLTVPAKGDLVLIVIDDKEDAWAVSWWPAGGDLALAPPPVGFDWGIVTALPAGAVLGDYCSLKVREAEAFPWKLWRCQKVEAAGERPWSVFDGAALRSEYVAGEFLSTESETPQTTNAPSITIPSVKMEADIRWGTNLAVTAAANAQARNTLYVAGSVYTVGTGGHSFSAVGGTGPTVIAPLLGTARAVALAASTAVQNRYSRISGTGVVTFYTPWLEINPVRVG